MRLPRLLSGMYPAPIALLLSTACASVGPAPAALSAELGDRMAEMRGLHQLALERVFENERRRVEDFIEDEWTPLFLKNFLAESRLLPMIDRLGTIGEEERALLRTTLADSHVECIDHQVSIDPTVHRPADDTT